MYSTCLFCNRPLGTNQVLEEFPVGRRLAFDAARGRLWVVCQKCERWNLTPIEERWEAVEACERIFRETRLRVSTGNIGLGRHAEGLQLVRIGEPLRPEFAAWRYGDQFGRRRRRTMLYTAGGLGLLAGISLVGPVIVGGSGLGGYWLWQAWEGIAASRTRVRLHTDDGRLIKLRRDDLPTARLRPMDDGTSFRLSLLKGRKQEWFEGDEARRFATRIIPSMNRMGGRKVTVQAAVQEIEARGHPDRFLADVVHGDRFRGRKGAPGYIHKMPAPTKLALEMALHEEEERRALDGELWRLERAWREAEEIATIADDLLPAPGAGTFIDRHRGAKSADS